MARMNVSRLLQSFAYVCLTLSTDIIPVDAVVGNDIDNSKIIRDNVRSVYNLSLCNTPRERHLNDHRLFGNIL